MSAVFFPGPLPAASSKQAYYEAITGGDTLAMTLLELWRAKTKPDAKITLAWSDR